MEKLNPVEKKVTNLYFPENGGRWILESYSVQAKRETESIDDY